MQLAATLGVTRLAVSKTVAERERIGPRRVAAATCMLREVLDLHGASTAVRTRRVRPPG